MAGNIFEGCAVSDLEAILALKERRAAEIIRLGVFFASPVVCFKLNIAGGVKRFPLSAHFFYGGVKRIVRALTENNFARLHEAVWEDGCGDTAFFACKGDARALKRLMCAIEADAPGGRLYDIDVYSDRGLPYARDGLDLKPRACLVCGGPAHFCVRSRRHPLEQMLEQTVAIMRKRLPKTLQRQHMTP
jgi:holo-ACP synthase CitX